MYILAYSCNFKVCKLLMFLVTLCGDKNRDDDFLIRRYSINDSYDDSGHLMNGDIVSLFHISTNKPPLYSHPILLDDGSQEVSCHGSGHEENNKVHIIFFKIGRAHV